MPDLDQEIQSVIESRIFKAAKSIKKSFPKSISDGSGFYVNFGNEELHVIVFLDSSEKQALKARLENKYAPFPGLFTMEEDVSAAFRFENSKNCIIESSTVNNSYALSLGKNSSIILVDHIQEVNTQELGHVKYKIDLGFIITFPEDSLLFDLKEAFDDLISYYISTRRESK